MAQESISDRLRSRRRNAGLSQPNIAAYGSGRRAPAAETLDRLDRALRVPTLERIEGARDAILLAAERRRLSNVRVFGSATRGEAGPNFDVNLLVHPDADVVSDRGRGPVMDRIRAEAVVL